MGDSPNKAKVWVCSGTGITHEHVKFLQGDGAAEAFFTGKAKMTFDTSTIRATSMWSRNTFSIHLASAASELADCDFICYKNETEGVFWVNKIKSIELVNVNTTRVYFEPDYWHTWIEKVKFGYSLTERRHFEDMSDPYLSLTPEPVNVPLMQRVYDMGTVNDKIKKLYLSAKVYIYLTSDEYNNSNNPNVKLNLIGGAPFWGVVKDFETLGEATEYLKTYINNTGITQSSQLPILSNVQRVVIVPPDLMEESLSGYEDQGEEDFTVPTGRFGKVYSPQYFNGSIVSIGNGQILPFDISRCGFTNKGQVKLQYIVQGCGGVHPKLRVSFFQYGKSFGSLESNNTCVVDMPDFPEVPVNAYLAPRPTTFGAVSATIGGIFSGAGKGAAASTLLGAPEAAPVAAAGGAAIGAFVALNQAINPEASNYVNAGATPEMNLAQGLFFFKTVMNIPTPDGLKILEDFFNTFGYLVLKREITRLDYGANFTYIKLGEPATNQNSAVPRVAFDDISKRLQDGVTVWRAEIGSVGEYS